MKPENVKLLVFSFVIFIIIVLFFALLANMQAITANLAWILVAAAFIILIWKFDFLVLLSEYERVVIMRFGRVARVGGPGWALIIPVIESVTKVDLRTQTIDVPKQDVITKENIELKIDAVIYLKVKKEPQAVINSVVEVEDYKNAVQLYVVSAIRDVMGGMLLADVIANTATLGQKLKEQVQEISKNWGIGIEAVEIKDVDIPPTVLDAMHAEKAAIQQKLARMEKAKAHQAEIDAVRVAAEGLSDKALAYYYIRALEKLGRGKSTKFIFPMELTKLAEAIGGSVAGRPSKQQVEDLFEKYAPSVISILDKQEKAKLPLKKPKKK